VRIEIVGDLDPASMPQAATTRALEHAADRLGLTADVRWLPTIELGTDEGQERLRSAHGLWIAPGSPYRNMAGVLDAIRFAREERVPLLATCGGFQHVVLEFARNVMGFEDAQHAEYDPYASRLIIARLDCSLVGRSLRISLAPHSLAAATYRASEVVEEYHCNFGVHPEYVPELRAAGLRITGSDAEGEVRVVEQSGHPFFVATLFVPQTRSTPAEPHPLVLGFLAAVGRPADI
jgi:CTP synthase (UTP-ammonia lyase)